MKIVTVVGARPQFIKAAAVSRAIRINFNTQIEEVLVHTGQHHDENMSSIFFEELEIPKPNYNLEISGGTHGSMTGRMLAAVETILISEKPDWMLVYGDTNSTLAGALAAVKLRIPVAHVEAGLRSFNMNMPEEINRILTDRISSMLFCPTTTAVRNLADENRSHNVYNVGDVMYDVSLFYGDRARQKSTILQDLDLRPNEFALATCHRAENTDDPSRLSQILLALNVTSRKLPVVMPMHPRTRKLITEHGMNHLLKGIRVLDPAPFLDMILLEQNAEVIFTDSGGVQKEALFYRVPCITMRDETEWVETVDSGWNQLTGANSERILAALDTISRNIPLAQPYGKGDASDQLVHLMYDQHRA